MRELSYYEQQRKANLTNRFYIYVHIRPDTGKPFYVGKGCGYRAWSRTSRNPYWKNINAIGDRKVEILFDNLTEDDAFQVEKDVILEYKYFGYKLANLTEGGDGCSGLVLSEDAKKLLSVAAKNQWNSLSPEEYENRVNRLVAMSMSKKGTKLPRDVVERARLAKLDKTVYSFHHLDGRDFSGTKEEFKAFTGLVTKQLSSLFAKSGKPSIYGWGLVTTPRDKLVTPLAGRPKTKEHTENVRAAKRCKNVYLFQYTDGLIFQGTRYQFECFAEIDRRVVSSLFGSKPSMTTRGWKLLANSVICKL